MSKLFYGIFLMILSTINLKVLKAKTKCMNLGDNCDLTSYCCGKWVCKDYRCAVKGTKDNQVAWAPDGEKCDWFHHCGKNYKCQSHRCVFQIKDIIKALTKKVKNAAATRV